MTERNLSDANYWRPFPTDDQYLISRNGEVWSLKRNRLLNGAITERNSVHITVYHKNKGGRKPTHYPVHILVMKVWGPEPKKGQTHIRHINRDSRDNRLENLAWYDPHKFNGKNWEGV